MNEALKEAVQKYLVHQFVRALDDSFMAQLFELIQNQTGGTVELPCTVQVDEKTANLIRQKLLPQSDKP